MLAFHWLSGSIFSMGGRGVIKALGYPIYQKFRGVIIETYDTGALS